MVSWAAIATRARGSTPAASDSETKVAPSPASGLDARASIASIAAASSGATQVMCWTTPSSCCALAAVAPAAPRAAAPARAASMRRARIGAQSRPDRRPRPAAPVTPRYPGAVERPADEARRRRIAIALVALAIFLFIVEIVALAVGLLEVAALIFVIFIGGWFALRSYQRRTGGA